MEISSAASGRAKQWAMIMIMMMRNLSLHPLQVIEACLEAEVAQIVRTESLAREPTQIIASGSGLLSPRSSLRP